MIKSLTVYRNSFTIFMYHRIHDSIFVQNFYSTLSNSFTIVSKHYAEMASNSFIRNIRAFPLFRSHHERFITRRATTIAPKYATRLAAKLNGLNSYGKYKVAEFYFMNFSSSNEEVVTYTSHHHETVCLEHLYAERYTKFTN